MTLHFSRWKKTNTSRHNETRRFQCAYILLTQQWKGKAAVKWGVLVEQNPAVVGAEIVISISPSRRRWVTYNIKALRGHINAWQRLRSRAEQLMEILAKLQHVQYPDRRRCSFFMKVKCVTRICRQNRSVILFLCISFSPTWRPIHILHTKVKTIPFWICPQSSRHISAACAPPWSKCAASG